MSDAKPRSAYICRAVFELMSSPYSPASDSSKGWFLIVDQPWDPESINKLAEQQRPEGLGNRYLYGAIFRKGAEDAFRLIGVPGPEHYAETLRLLVFARHGITGL